MWCDWWKNRVFVEGWSLQIRKKWLKSWAWLNMLYKLENKVDSYQPVVCRLHRLSAFQKKFDCKTYQWNIYHWIVTLSWKHYTMPNSAKLTYVMSFKWFAVKIRLNHLASSSTFTHRSIWREIIQYAQMNRKLLNKRKKRLSFSASETQEIKPQHWGFDLITFPRGLIPHHYN